MYKYVYYAMNEYTGTCNIWMETIKHKYIIQRQRGHHQWYGAVDCIVYIL